MKRKILIDEKIGDEEKLQRDQIRLVRTREEYHRFSKAAGLPEQYERMEIAGFTWKQGKAAEKVNQGGKLESGVKEVTTDDRRTIRKAQADGKRNCADNSTRIQTEKSEIILEWDESRGTKCWAEDRKKRLISAEYASVREPVEYGILYDSNGKRVFRKKGDNTSVDFTPTQIKQMRGGVLTHNHPGANYGCFSPADIDMLREGRLAEIRVATPAGVFSMQRPKKWPSGINGLAKIKDVYYDIDNTIGSEYWARAYRGEMSFLDADNFGQRAVVEELCRRYKIPFRFDSWDDLGRDSYESIFRSNT